MDEKHSNSIYDLVDSLKPQVSSVMALAYQTRDANVTLNRALLTQKYTELGLVQVLIDQPVDDAFRGGIKIHCPELSPDDIAMIEHEIEEMGVLNTYAQALKWARLFGGAGVIINVGQDTKKPLDIEKIKLGGPLAFYAADRWELQFMPGGVNLMDQLTPSTNEYPYNYYGHIMHKTHVIKLDGKMAPSLIRGQFGGWGMSELEKVVSSINQYLKHQAVTYELLDESKIDVFSIAGFNANCATRDGVQKTAARIQAAAQIKNFQNALCLDKEDTYDQKSINFSGLSDILQQIRIGLACDLRMPLTKIFGLSVSGLGAGDEDIENYNSMVETEIRSKVKGGLITMLKIMCKHLFDYIPETVGFDWHPLREVSNQEKTTIKNDALNRVINAMNAGLVTPQKAVEMINNEKVFDLELPVDEAIDASETMEPEPSKYIPGE